MTITHLMMGAAAAGSTAALRFMVGNTTRRVVGSSSIGAAGGSVARMVATPSVFATTPRHYATETAAAPSGTLSLTLALPHQTVYKQKEVLQVNLSGASGDIGILANHVPIIEELKPGILEVIEKDGQKTKLFVSGGFAAVHPDSSLNINAVEAFPLEVFDKEAVRTQLQAATANADAAKDPAAQATAKIEVEVLSALQHALP